MTPARDHTGEVYGPISVLECLPDLDSSGRRIYRVRWACCGSEDIERQTYLTKARTQPPVGCRDCHQTGRARINTTEGDTPGYLDVPGWGRMYVLRGPMGPRWSVNGGHTGWAKSDGVEE